MSYFAQTPFSASSLPYKSCLIVTDEPRSESSGYSCQSRIVLGGRMNLPLPPAAGVSASEAKASAIEAARKAIDRIEASMSG